MFGGFDTSRPELVIDEALERLAEKAGEGELRAKAIKSLDAVRVTVELGGWVLLEELHLDDGVVIRHGLIGPAGIVVMVPAGPVPKYEHAVEADRQARALAHELELAREDVVAVVALFGSDATPAVEHLVDFSVCVVGDRQLVTWLDAQPERLGPPLLDRLRAAIGRHERRAASERPLLLPTTPLQG